MSYVLPSLTGLAYFKRNEPLKDRTVDEKSSQEDEREGWESKRYNKLVEEYKTMELYRSDENYKTELKDMLDHLLEEKAHEYAIDQLDMEKQQMQDVLNDARIYAESQEKSIRDARNTRPSTSPR